MTVEVEAPEIMAERIEQTSVCAAGLPLPDGTRKCPHCGAMANQPCGRLDIPHAICNCATCRRASTSTQAGNE